MPPSQTNFAALLGALTDANVEFILVGGVAAILHGAARMTFDVDVVYARGRENLRRLVAALDSHRPYLRGAPAGLPFRWDERTLRAGLNFTLETAVGDLDLLGEIAGGGTYEQLLPHSQEVAAFGLRLRVVTLEKLILLKRAAGRPKDLEPIAELLALLQERQRQQTESESGTG